MVCKPLISREWEFYKTIYRDFPHLSSLAPEFHGSLTIRNQKNSTQQEAQLLSSDTILIHHNHMHEYMNSSAIPQQFLPSTTCSEYIVLKDLTAGMSKPCAMDMKVCISDPYIFDYFLC